MGFREIRIARFVEMLLAMCFAAFERDMPAVCSACIILRVRLSHLGRIGPSEGRPL